jgi:TetR/AcrR family transcriptional repressor of mexJK operon
MTLKVKSFSIAQPHLYGKKEKLILEAARRLFAHYGFSKVTMEEVAEDIGVVKGCIYYYFPTKESLFGAVIREEQKQFAKDIDELSEAEFSYAELLHHYVEKRQQFFRELANLSRLDYHSWTRIKSTFRDLFRNFEQQELGFLQRVFQEGHTSGEFLACDARRTASLLLHALQGLYLRTMRDADSSHPDRKTYSQLDIETRYFAEVFVRGIRPSTQYKRTKHESR